MSRRLSLFLCLLLCTAARAEPPPAKNDRADAYGDRLPADALMRLGTTRFRSGTSLTGVTLSPDGTTLAVATGNKLIRFLDVATGKETRQITLPQFGLSQPSFTADGKGLVVRTANGPVQLLDLDGKVLGSADTGPNRSGGSFVVSADGNVVAAGAQNYGRDRMKPSAWDVKTGKQLGPFEALAGQDVRVALSGDGKVLATWGRAAPPRGGLPRPEDMEMNQTVQLWDTTTGKEIVRLKGEPSGAVVAGVALSSDGKHAAVANGQATVTLWDASGKPTHKLAGRRGMGERIAFSPDGKTLVAAAPDGTTILWETATGKRLGLCEQPDCVLLGVVFPPKKAPRAYGGNRQALSVWELPSGEVLTPQGGHQAMVSALTFAPDGQSMWSAGADGRLFQWDLATGRELRQLELRDEYVSRGGARYLHHPVFSPDGRYLLGTGTGMRLWELGRGRVVCDFDGSSSGQAVSVAFSPDGSLLAVPTAPPRPQPEPAPLRLWDVASGQALRELHGLKGEVRQVVFSPDGKRIAASAFSLDRAGAGGPTTEINVWQTASGKAIAHVVRKQSGLPWVAFTPDGKHVLLAAQDRTLRLLDADTGQETRTLPVEFAFATVPVVCAPDGRTLAVVTTGGVPDGRSLGLQIQLFEAATGKLRCALEGHEGPITALAFSRDGRLMATGGNDTTVLLWDLTGKLRLAREGAPAGKWAEEAWQELDSSDAEKAFRALQRLASAPGEALPLLKKHLSSAAASDAGEDKVEKLIRNLDADEFAVRQQASQDLARMGAKVRAALEKTLKTDASAEVKRRIEELLEKLTPAAPAGESVRPTRALEVLERIGTAEARKLVETLAAGRAGTPLTEEAKATLARMRPAD